jgi:hypothetical protein
MRSPWTSVRGARSSPPRPPSRAPPHDRHLHRLSLHRHSRAASWSTRRRPTIRSRSSADSGACHGDVSRSGFVPGHTGPRRRPGLCRALAAAIGLPSRPEANLGLMVITTCSAARGERSERSSRNYPKGLQKCSRKLCGGRLHVRATLVISCWMPLDTIMTQTHYPRINDPHNAWLGGHIGAISCPWRKHVGTGYSRRLDRRPRPAGRACGQVDPAGRHSRRLCRRGLQ